MYIIQDISYNVSKTSQSVLDLISYKKRIPYDGFICYRVAKLMKVTPWSDTFKIEFLFYKINVPMFQTQIKRFRSGFL